jgi:hypothetical protein
MQTCISGAPIKVRLINWRPGRRKSTCFPVRIADWDKTAPLITLIYGVIESRCIMPYPRLLRKIPHTFAEGDALCAARCRVAIFATECAFCSFVFIYPWNTYIWTTVFYPLAHDSHGVQMMEMHALSVCAEQGVLFVHSTLAARQNFCPMHVRALEMANAVGCAC